MVATLTPERVVADAAAYLDALAARPDVAQDRVATVGYCMGGRMAYLAAAHHPARVRAAASFHAGGLVTAATDSPHLLATRVEAAVYFGIADADAGCTPDHQGALAAALGAGHVDYRLELYPGKRHGFAIADHAVHDADAEARHWRRLEPFLAETIG